MSHTQEQPTAARARDPLRQRYHEIASVLVRHGLGYLAEMLGLERFIQLPHDRNGGAHTQPEHVRMALEELGATFIKLGQIVSTRPDLVPPDLQAELAKLQDQAPPVPASAIRDVLRAELGHPPEEVFQTFGDEPLAAASIGQVHAATLPDGTDVVVKVRRPGVVEQVEQDLEILQNLAAAASRRWERAEDYDLVGLAQEFAQQLRAELDYVREGRSAERFAENFAESVDVHIPRVYQQFSTSRVLTLERIRGIKISDLAALEAEHIDRHALAERAVRIVLQMIFEDGFFHADPHPGNFFVEPSGRVALIDFGMVGTLDEATQARLVDLIVAVTNADAERLVDAFLELGVARKPVDRAALRRDLEHLVSRYHDLPLGEIALAPLIEEALEILRKHHLHVPVDLALLLKTAIMGEGLGAQLDPQFHVATILQPYVQRMVVRQYSPRLCAGKFAQASLDAARLGTELPQQVRRLLAELEAGHIAVGMRPTDFDPLLQKLEPLINRLVLGMLATAFIIGLAVLMTVYRPPSWGEQYLGTFFAVGFVIAAGLGVYFAVTILRARRL